MEITPGCVVVSRAGHDKGRVFAVLDVEGGAVRIADGDTRRVGAPKRKNIRHLAYLGRLETADAKSLEDHILRKLLKTWR